MQRREFLRATLATSAALLCGRARSADALAKITSVTILRVREKEHPEREKRYLEIATDVSVFGLGGDLYLEQPRRLEDLLPKLRELLVGRDPADRALSGLGLWDSIYPKHELKAYAEGRDPLTGETIWDTRRKGRHTATGSVILALSAVDNALWDLRGKLAGKPVYRLLGDGDRARLPAYVSVMPPDEIEAARKQARALFDRGFTRQKWFLRHGPPDGKEGFRATVGLVEALRTELGRDARLMFDFAVGERGRCDWDVPYAISVAKAIAPFDPYWLEEPFSPEEIEAYERLKGETDIPLATGEHTYTRWNIRPFLERKIASFVQSDPEWCGGISELLEIAKLVRGYEGVRLVPHGHHVLAAAAVVASQPETLCPMVEYGLGWMPGRQSFQARPVEPVEGSLTLPDGPGLGPDLDWDRVERA